MDTSASFGAWLKQRRNVLDLTQAQLADRAGCATVTIHKIEADGLRPSRQMAEQLAAALEVPSADLAAFLQAARAGVALAERGAADAAAVPTVPAPLPPTATLPRPPTPLIGRTRELAETVALLAAP